MNPMNPRTLGGAAFLIWAVAHRRPFGAAFTLIAEALRVSSHREARRQLQDAPNRVEDSITLLLRWSP